MVQPSKILSSELKHDDWIKVYTDKIELPDGNQMDYNYVVKEDAVAILALTDDKKVVMVEQFRVPSRRILLELPAGFIEPGELPEEAALRELKEESGYEASGIIPLGSFIPTTGMLRFNMYCFFASGLTKGEDNQDKTEFLDLKLVSLEELHEMVLDGDKDAATMICYFLAKEQNLLL